MEAMNIDETFAIHKLGARSKDAYRRAVSLLGDTEDWEPWPKVVEAMRLGEDPVTAKTASDILRGLEYLGLVERRGKWNHRAATDGREIRLCFCCADCGVHLRAADSYGPNQDRCSACWGQESSSVSSNGNRSSLGSPRARP
jgi:hypothetical protein